MAQSQPFQNSSTSGNVVSPSARADANHQDRYGNDFSSPSWDAEEQLNPVQGEIALWRAVITQALMDAASNSAKPEAQQDKLQAIRWLLGFSEDFVTVCHNADLDPSFVRQKAKEALARNCQWRAEAGKGPKSLALRPASPSLPRIPEINVIAFSSAQQGNADRASF